MLGKNPAIAHKLYGFLLLYFPLLKLPRRLQKYIFHIDSMYQLTQGMSQSCNEMLASFMENALARTSLVGGPLCGEKKAPFYTESSKKSISLGNLTILSFQIKHILSHTRIVQDSRVFMEFVFPFLLMKSIWKYSMYMSLQPNSLNIS